MAYTAGAEKAADRVLSGVKQAQDMTVNAVSTVTGLVGSFLPEMPSLPFAAKLPRPEAVVKTGFGIAESVLKTNKQYALGLVQAFEPITGKVLPAKQAARKTASK
ncbi:MAG TPA: hypothetical protein VM841_13335 [Actinomycetota bacterium]|nr:hypothetical protein [Actinomycetota bacterium]